MLLIASISPLNQSVFYCGGGDFHPSACSQRGRMTNPQHSCRLYRKEVHMTPRNQTGINDKMKRLLTPDQSAAPFGFSATTFDSRHPIYSINVIEQTYSSTLISFRLVRSNLSPSGEGITSTLSPSVVTFSIISICFSVNFFSFLPIKTTYSQDRLSPPTRYSCKKIMSIAEYVLLKYFYHTL